MTQGSSHDENAFHQIVCTDLDFGFCYLTEVADSEKLELVEAADIEVCMQVADIEQRQCMDKGSIS